MKKHLLAILFSLFASITYAKSYLIDVRSQQEFSAEHAEGAIHLPVEDISAQISAITTDKNDEIYLYCRSGRRAEAAAQMLRQLGYQKVHNLGTLAQAQAFVEEQAQ